MSMITLPTTAVDNVRMKLAGPDLELLRRMAIQLDRLSYRTMPAFDSWGGFDLAMPGATPAHDYRVWWGSVPFMTGMTSLVITGKASGYGSADLKVYINGALNSTITLGATFSHTISITSGYADGDIIEVEVVTNGNTTKTGQIRVMSVYTTPIAPADTWPGVPTFTTSYPASKVNQLINAIDWLFRRINMVPMPLSVGQIYAPASYKAGEWVRWRGVVTRFHSEDRLRIIGRQTTLNPSERLKVYFDGVLVDTQATRVHGETTIVSFPVTLASIAVGSQVEVVIVNEILTGNYTTYPTDTDPRKRIHSRFNLMAVRTEPQPAYAVASPPPAFSADQSISQANLTTYLNNLASLLGTIKSRIDGNAALWNRAYAMRKRYGGDAKEVTKAIPTYPHGTFRRGRRLVVCGKGITLGWGAMELETNEGNPVYDKVKYAHTQTLTDGDKIETKHIALDDIAGLPQNTPYRLYGPEIVYAAEHWE